MPRVKGTFWRGWLQRHFRCKVAGIEARLYCMHFFFYSSGGNGCSVVAEMYREYLYCCCFSRPWMNSYSSTCCVAHPASDRTLSHVDRPIASTFSLMRRPCLVLTHCLRDVYWLHTYHCWTPVRPYLCHCHILCFSRLTCLHYLTCKCSEEKLYEGVCTYCIWLTVLGTCCIFI